MARKDDTVASLSLEQAISPPAASLRGSIDEEAAGILPLIASLGHGKLSSIDSAKSIAGRVDFVKGLHR